MTDAEHAAVLRRYREGDGTIYQAALSRAIERAIELLESQAQRARIAAVLAQEAADSAEALAGIEQPRRTQRYSL